MAKSYVQQANFDLPQALSSVEKANGLNPNDAIILARLAELRLSNDDKKGAQDAAEFAKTANPNNSRTQTVFGFIKLSQFDIDDAKNSFNAAIEFNEADPLPRLGLGLANIRKNDIEEGKKNIEIAVSLDPGNSLLRSYLGKTYFENNDDDQAAEQLALAEGFDSNDPTPSLYSAFVNQSNNKPTQALKDLQKSIEKNDNRAVYRSRLALDEDLATRSASAARIYDELGFDQLTILEGAKSLAQDPGNYSAHRLMADAYLNRPRHEIARVSELLQSQIRQPLNNNPAQVQLSDSRLGAFRDSGPFDVSFNEFSRLYTKEGFSGSVGLVAGENSTHGEEVQVSNLKGDTLFTLTGYNFETDGGRENADEDNELFNFFVQHQLTDRTNVQAEYRKVEIKEGFKEIFFDFDNFDENIETNQDFPSYRFSLSHKLNLNHEFLFNTRSERSKVKAVNIDLDPETEFTRVGDVDSELFEFQHLYNSKKIDSVFGLGYLSQDRFDSAFTSDFILGEGQLDIHHKNAYLYVYPKTKNTEFTFGVSRDDFDDIDLGTKITSPKIGIIHSINNTELRAAYLETFKRTIVADQTLEPTNVSGFNQFYDDLDATESRLKGIGIDQKLNLFDKTAYVGVEYSERDLTVPTFTFDGVIKGDISEEIFRAYTYLPLSNWSFGIYYEDEDFKRKEFFEGPELIVNMQTKRYGLDIAYYASKNLSIGFDLSYVDQKGEFVDQLFVPYSGEDEFFNFDAEISYKFRKFLNRNLTFGEITFQVKNIFDEEFSYQNADISNSRYETQRAAYLNLSFSF